MKGRIYWENRCNKQKKINLVFANNNLKNQKSDFQMKYKKAGFIDIRSEQEKVFLTFLLYQKIGSQKCEVFLNFYYKIRK